MPLLSGRNAARITIVDDEPSMRDVLARALRTWGHTSQQAGSAEAALELLDAQRTDLVITDLRMPGKGGVWLVRELHERWPDTGIIVITAGEDADAAVQCLNSGADRYFFKPINFEELNHGVATVLHTVSLQKERERYRAHLERMVHRQMRRSRRTFLSAIDSLVRTLEARDSYTKGHSLRVRHYALHLARALRLAPGERKQLSLAAKLHDIGKVGVPEHILNKPGRLTSAEFESIREHPAIGERILMPIIRNRTVLGAIRGHHERLDGKGYPDGLRGEAIPLLARLIAVVDCYDALTSSRAYRSALSTNEACAALRAGAGAQFDPELVRAFLGLDATVLAYGHGARCSPSAAFLS